MQEKLETLKDHLNTILHDKTSLKFLMSQILKDVDFIDHDEWNNFKRIFCEFTLENIFYRKDSKVKSYQPPYKREFPDKIESQNIPVYSFRY